jgi:RND family efflux transporter MFP subunit
MRERNMIGHRDGVARLLLGGILLLAAAGCGGDGAAETVPGEAELAASALILGAADVQVVHRSEMAAGVVLTGSLQPYRIVDVRAQVAGTIGSLAVDRGDAVRQGQPMATIEAEGIRGAAAGAAAGVAAAEANLALAQQRLESARTLFDAGAMSQLDFRAAQAAYEAARAQLAAAQAQSLGASEQARRATVTAPISGEVSDRQVNGGEAVTPGQTLFTVVNTEFLELAGQVPVDQAARVRPGQPVEFQLGAYPDQTFRGTVARIEPTANPDTRQIGVYLRLENPNRALVGGLFASGRVLAEGGESTIVVPTTAIRGSGADTYVWVIEDGAAVRRPVVTGRRDDSRDVVAIASGLQGGEQVVIAPGELREGAPVRIGTEPAAAAAEAAEG